MALHTCPVHLFIAGLMEKDAQQKDKWGILKRMYEIFNKTFFLLLPYIDWLVFSAILLGTKGKHDCWVATFGCKMSFFLLCWNTVIFHSSKWINPLINTFQLPMEVLEMILLEVVLQDGDTAYMNLSLTCSCFRAIVNKARFRQKAHYAWLDSKCVKV